MGLRSLFSLLGRSRHSSKANGLFAILRSYRHAPPSTVRHRRSIISTPAVLSTTDLITRRAIALQKRTEDLSRLHSKVLHARLNAAIRFKKEHAATIKDYNFQLGDLVLMRNMVIEKALNRKMHARYLGPLIVISRNKGSAYILAELDGTLFDRPVAAFRVIPYLARAQIDLPPLDELLDVSIARLHELQNTTYTDTDEYFDDDDAESQLDADDD